MLNNLVKYIIITNGFCFCDYLFNSNIFFRLDIYRKKKTPSEIEIRITPWARPYTYHQYPQYKYHRMGENKQIKNKMCTSVSVNALKYLNMCPVVREFLRNFPQSSRLLIPVHGRKMYILLLLLAYFYWNTSQDRAQCYTTYVLGSSRDGNERPWHCVPSSVRFRTYSTYDNGMPSMSLLSYYYYWKPAIMFRTQYSTYVTINIISIENNHRQ